MRPLITRIARTGILSEPMPEPEETWREPALELQAELLAVVGAALTIRHVDAGSCNACELEIQAVSNPYYNLEGAGIRFVASPRHADLLLVTGPVVRHMETALLRTYAATPEPRWVVALGDCAAGCGVHSENYACRRRVSDVIPVHVTVPGCPPPPLDILRGILTLVRNGRMGPSGRPPVRT